MKAVVYTRYGGPEVLAVRDVPRPVAGDDDLLIRVHAASINSWDWDLLRGTPRVFRFLSGYLKPRRTILGADVAGTVAAVGKDVRHFKAGDEVFGDLCADRWGGFAEYVCARESSVAPKPPSMTFTQAAAIPQAGVMALQGIRDMGKTHAGQRVLLNGGGGGVGTFAIQMARSVGAEVTCVDHTTKLDGMRALGADHVVDYTREDVTGNGERYDLILDVVARHSMFDYRRSLTPTGRYVLVGGATSRLLQVLLVGAWLSLTRSTQKMGILAHAANRNLADLTGLFEAGTVVPVIDRTYPLSETVEALRYFGTGSALGKVVVTVAGDPDA